MLKTMGNNVEYVFSAPYPAMKLNFTISSLKQNAGALNR